MSIEDCRNAPLIADLRAINPAIADRRWAIPNREICNREICNRELGVLISRPDYTYPACPRFLLPAFAA